MHTDNEEPCSGPISSKDVFDIASSRKLPLHAVASTPLKSTTLGLDPTKVQFAAGPTLKPTPDAKYWAE
jgi:hypothetical protein